MDMTVFSPTWGNGCGMALQHVGRSCDPNFTKTAEELAQMPDGGMVSELVVLDVGWTEFNKEAKSVMRDERPIRASHAASRLLSSAIFSLCEIVASADT